MNPRHRQAPVVRRPGPVFPQVDVAEDRRFELLRGCPNTLSKCAHQRPPQAGTVRDVRLSVPADSAGRPRTHANETTIETTSRPTALKLVGQAPPPLSCADRLRAATDPLAWRSSARIIHPWLRSLPG